MTTYDVKATQTITVNDDGGGSSEAIVLLQKVM